MDSPTPQPTDPLLTLQAQQAQRDQVNALQVEAAGDTASLMARYGTRLALAGTSSGSPLLAGTAARSPSTNPFIGAADALKPMGAFAAPVAAMFSMIGGRGP